MRFAQPSQGEPRAGVWWQPSLIREVVNSRAERRLLLYVVVDDLDGLDATLVGYPWPEVTDVGTLHFGAFGPFPSSGQDEPEPGSGVWLASTAHNDRVTRAELQAKVNDNRFRDRKRYTRNRTGSGLAPRRPIRVGDVFAFVLNEPIQPTHHSTSARLQANVNLSSVDIYDITFESREASRAAFLAAIAPPIRQEEFDQETGPFAQPARVDKAPTPSLDTAGEADTGMETTQQASPNI